MSPDNDAGPAFPFPTHNDDGAVGQWAHSGMTLRDWFASTATDLDIAAICLRVGTGNQNPCDRVQARYEHADAMIERGKIGPEELTQHLGPDGEG